MGERGREMGERGGEREEDIHVHYYMYQHQLEGDACCTVVYVYKM